MVKMVVTLETKSIQKIWIFNFRNFTQTHKHKYQIPKIPKKTLSSKRNLLLTHYYILLLF